MAALTEAKFRATLPEFGDDSAWPAATIAPWLAVASTFVNPVRWGDAADLGASLYVAHNIVLGAQASRAGSVGGLPGAAGGVVSSKSVGPVSKSYDTSIGTLDGAGAWNLTSYGVRYQQLVQIFGAGAVQL